MLLYRNRYMITVCTVFQVKKLKLSEVRVIKQIIIAVSRWLHEYKKLFPFVLYLIVQ